MTQATTKRDENHRGRINTRMTTMNETNQMPRTCRFQQTNASKHTNAIEQHDRQCNYTSKMHQRTRTVTSMQKSLQLDTRQKNMLNHQTFIPTQKQTNEEWGR